MTIEIVDLGTWGSSVLASEYDPEDDAIRVNRRAVARICEELGARAAERFIACAVAHERFHRERPHASEREARAYARAATGADGDAFENVLARR